MSRIEELIAELCPRGVNFATLRESGTWYGGGTPSKSVPEFWDGGSIPWLSPKDMGAGTLDSTEDLITESALSGSNVKLVPAGSVAFVVRSNILRRRLPIAHVPFAVTLNQDMRALVPHEGLLIDYLALVCRASAEKIRSVAVRTDGSMAAVQGPELMNFRIPIPPRAVQQEIVAILGEMEYLQSGLEAELEAELGLRVRQHNYYRDSLLRFADRRVEWAAMGEVGEFIRGRRFTKADLVERGVECIHFGEIYTRYGPYTDRVFSHVRSDLAPNLRFAKTGDLVIAAVSETVEDICKAVAWLGDGDVAVHDDCFYFRHTLNPKFVAYYFQTAAFHSEKEKFVARAKVKRISGESLAKMRIPVPTLKEQERIVTILDAFDSLANDISLGLTAEITARRKQYEHYRAKLLTFDEAA